MKQTILFLLLSSSIFCFGQVNSKYNLEYFLSSAKKMEFDLKVNDYDSVVKSSGFDFVSFLPIKGDEIGVLYKTFYSENKIELIEYYTINSVIKLEYQCYVNDFDSLKYFVFITNESSDTTFINHCLGVNIKSEKISLLYASHKNYYKDAIIKYDSSYKVIYEINNVLKNDENIYYESAYRIKWINDSYYSGYSIFVIDSSLVPVRRFHFRTDYLIYFTYINIINETCSETIFSYNPRIDQTFRKGCLSSFIDIPILKSIINSNRYYPTYIAKSDYSIDNYYFKWEYYKSFIGKRWSEYK